MWDSDGGTVCGSLRHRLRHIFLFASIYIQDAGNVTPGIQQKTDN
jgi:hypothetical protein